MAGAIGLDNRKILPPFFPFCRSEDAILSRVISKCFTDAYFGRLPFTIDHLPRAGRTYGPSVDTRLADIVIAFVSTFEWPEYMVGGEDSLQALGSHLESLASLPAERFSLLQQELLWQRTSAMIRALEEFLARNPEGPAFWSEHIVSQMVRLRQSVLAPCHAVPSDLLDHVPLTEIPAFTQDMIAQFGKLLYWWPAIVDRARALANGGVTVGQRLAGAVPSDADLDRRIR
jgi:hypothetical protein